MENKYGEVLFFYGLQLLCFEEKMALIVAELTESKCLIDSIVCL